MNKNVVFVSRSFYVINISNWIYLFRFSFFFIYLLFAVNYRFWSHLYKMDRWPLLMRCISVQISNMKKKNDKQMNTKPTNHRLWIDMNSKEISVSLISRLSKLIYYIISFVFDCVCMLFYIWNRQNVFNLKWSQWTLISHCHGISYECSLIVRFIFIIYSSIILFSDEKNCCFHFCVMI